MTLLETSASLKKDACCACHLEDIGDGFAIRRDQVEADVVARNRILGAG